MLKTGEALYVAWKLESTASQAESSLSRGQRLNLFRVRSWVAIRGEAQALLAPIAPLDEIMNAIWTEKATPIASRWIQGASDCAAVTHDIETAPVLLGLAQRPEQWRWSSAARK